MVAECILGRRKRCMTVPRWLGKVFGEFRIPLYRAPQQFRAFFQAIALREQQSEIAQRNGMLRLDCQCLPVTAFRVLEFPRQQGSSLIDDLRLREVPLLAVGLISGVGMIDRHRQLGYGSIGLEQLASATADWPREPQRSRRSDHPAVAFSRRPACNRRFDVKPAMISVRVEAVFLCSLARARRTGSSISGKWVPPA